LYYDSHTHLNDDKLYPDWQWYIQEFVDAGWWWLVNVWVDHQRNQRGIAIAQEASKSFPDTFVKATIGYHPSEVCFGKIIGSHPEQNDSVAKDLGHTIMDSSATPQNDNIKTISQAIQFLKDLYAQHAEHIVAIGECGIDTHYDGYSHITTQKELFAQHCDLAQELDLPIVIHSRDDFASTWDVVKNYKNEKIYFHCRGYGPGEVKVLQNYFPKLWIGFCGNVSYPKAQILRDSLYVTRPDAMLLETDAPYLAPQTQRGNTNKPLYVIDIYNYVASILSLDLPVLQSEIANNFQRLYNR